MLSETKVKIPYYSGSTFLRYEPQMISFSDYYPFGSIMPGRGNNPDSYRYGFNGMEEDNTLKGPGNSYDFGARMYDSRLGRWMSIDPLASLFPSENPYNFCINNPVVFRDPDGEKPRISMTVDANGTINITVTEVIFVVTKNNKQLSAAMRSIGNPSNFYPTTARVWVGLTLTNVNISYDIMTVTGYSSVRKAKRDMRKLGYGVVAEFDPSYPGGFHTNRWRYGGYIRFGDFRRHYRGEFAHELAHDWGGFADLYYEATYINDKGESSQGKALATDLNGNPIQSLMNDSYSPLSQVEIDAFAQNCVNNFLLPTGQGDYFQSPVDDGQQNANRVGQNVNVARFEIKDDYFQNPNQYPFIHRQSAFWTVTVGLDQKVICDPNSIVPNPSLQNGKENSQPSFR